jgi:hypothetical protein
LGRLTLITTAFKIDTMEDIIYKSIIGSVGTLATLELTPVNELLGLVVGLSTFIYMTASAIKVIKELRKKK